MSDLTIRLAAVESTLLAHSWGRGAAQTVSDAADEITRLRAEVERLTAAGIGYSQQTMDAVVKERDVLRAEVDRLTDAHKVAYDTLLQEAEATLVALDAVTREMDALARELEYVWCEYAPHYRGATEDEINEWHRREDALNAAAIKGVPESGE